MNTVINIRTSDLILDKVFNPANNAGLNKAKPSDIEQACGLIPDFFADACLEASDTLDNVACAMDNLYGFGGFKSYPYNGKVADDGTYTSEHEEDEDMSPLCRFGYESRFFCYVYEYGITSIQDAKTGETLTARFD
jgi:hypothetical protein